MEKTKYYSGIKRYIASRIGNPDDAEELTQCVFLEFYQSNDGFDNLQNPKAYLFGIARNMIADEKKRLSRESKFFSDQLLEHLSSSPNALSDPELRAYRVELIKAVKQAVNQLTKKQQQTIRLLYSEEMSPKEIARVSNCSLKAVQNRLLRVRGRLHQLLSHIKP